MFLKKNTKKDEMGDKWPHEEYDNKLNEHVNKVLELKGREGLSHFMVVKYLLPHNNFVTL